jgi:hypothetical protein
MATWDPSHKYVLIILPDDKSTSILVAKYYGSTIQEVMKKLYRWMNENRYDAEYYYRIEEYFPPPSTSVHVVDEMMLSLISIDKLNLGNPQGA